MIEALQDLGVSSDDVNLPNAIIEEDEEGEILYVDT